jgi:hypothetical protein
MPNPLPPPRLYEVVDPSDGQATNPWYDWALRVGQTLNSGISVTVTLAKITGGGTDGSLTIVNGLITAVVQPT